MISGTARPLVNAVLAGSGRVMTATELATVVRARLGSSTADGLTAAREWAAEDPPAEVRQHWVEVLATRP